MVVDLFEASPLAGGLGLGVVVAVLVAVALVCEARRVGAVDAVRRWPSCSSAVSVAIGHPSFEGLAVMIAVVLATGVAFLSEYKSDREFEMLNARKDAVRVKVIRGGAGPHGRRSKRSSSATSSCWRWATRSPPTAGSSRRPSCTSISR